MTTLDEAKTIFVNSTRKYLSGDLNGALEELGQAEKLARSAGDDVLVIYILAQKAGWLRELGRLDEGLQVLRLTEDIFTHLTGDNRKAALLPLRLEQGIEAKVLGNFPLAEKYLYEAAQSQGENRNTPMFSDILASLASVYMEQGKNNDALTSLTEAVAIDRNTKNIRSLSNDLNMLGLLYKRIGDQETAELYLKEAFNEAKKGGFLKESADAFCNHAANLDYAGRSMEAEKSFELALKAYEAIGNKPGIANVKSSLGIIAGKQGDLVKARQLLEGAHQLHLQTRHAVDAIYDILNLAQSEFDAHQYELAYEYALKAVKQTETLGLVDMMWRVHYMLARARAASIKDLQDEQKAIQILKEEIFPAYVKAIDAVELLREGINRPEEREYLFWDKEDLYGQAIYLATIFRQRQNAFSFSERARARAFLDIIGNKRLDQIVASNPLTQQRQELTRQLLEILGHNGDDVTKVNKLLDQLRLLRAEISSKEPAIAAVTEAQMPSLQEICNVIPNNAALVEFFVGPGNHLTVFVLTSKGIDQINIVDLGRIDLAAKIKQFRAEIEYEVEGVPTGEELYLILFSQVWDTIEPKERLFIVPHRELHLLPFGALWFKNIGEGPKRVYVCQRWVHSILPSAAFLPLCLNLPRKPIGYGSAKVLGNPTGDLLGAENEAKSVASQFGVVPLLGKHAKRAALLEPSNFAVVHVASHGEYNQVDPLLSGLLLNDGHVTVEDIMGSTISSGLLTLSGCVTALANRRPGDELIGLTRAAASAKIPSIITTLWPIRDDSSNIFFDYFYRCLLQGMPKDLALLTAQHKLIENEKFNHPVHWAPFVLFGDWR